MRAVVSTRTNRFEKTVGSHPDHEIAFQRAEDTQLGWAVEASCNTTLKLARRGQCHN